MSTGITLYAHVLPNAASVADGADLISSNWIMMLSVEAEGPTNKQQLRPVKPSELRRTA